MGVLRVMKEMKLSCCKCHFEFFFTTVANDEEGHPPIPFDILFHTHNDSYNSQTEPGSILHLHISHNTPCLPPKHFVYALSSIFPKVNIIPRRNSTKVLQNLEGQKRCITRDVQMANAVFDKRSLYLRFY